MTIDDKIRDEKLQYEISSAAAKIATLSQGKTDKCRYVGCEEVLASDQSRMIEQELSLLVFHLEKLTKNKDN